MKVSIITVTYNSAKTIVDTIESVLQQTYPHIEYIVVDGGSKDDTIEQVKRFETAFGDRLKWISEPDKGIYDAMNKIKGKYLSQDFVTMRMGGASTRNVRSLLILINEDVRACRENGVYTNTLMICTKFIYKFIGLLRAGSKCGS